MVVVISDTVTVIEALVGAAVASRKYGVSCNVCFVVASSTCFLAPQLSSKNQMPGAPLQSGKAGRSPDGKSLHEEYRHFS